MRGMDESFLYISQGRVYATKPGQPPQLIESKFGQSILDRAAQIQNRNAWKTQGSGARFMSGGLLWRQPNLEMEIPVVVNAISKGSRSGEFLYSLATHEIGGVFRSCDNGADEKRLLHTSDFQVGQLASRDSDRRIACVIRAKAESHLAVMNEDGSDLREVTQGDSLDLSPAWVPGANDELIFQSAGVARNQHGVPVGSSPSRIERLNLASGEITTILEDEQRDFLSPRMDAHGNLYCISKPYQHPSPRFNPFRAALDLVLLPFRLLFALFQFVNIFTMKYTGNTLVSSGGARQKEMDMRQMLIMNNLAQANRAPVKSLLGRNDWRIPRSWTLIQRSPSGENKVLEEGVLTFDLAGNGALLVSDGSRIWRRQPDGSKQELAKAEFISQVLAFQ